MLLAGSSMDDEQMVEKKREKKEGVGRRKSVSLKIKVTVKVLTWDFLLKENFKLGNLKSE